MEESLSKGVPVPKGAFRNALEGRHEKIADRLFATGEVDAMELDNSLWDAVKRGREHFVEKLITAGANVDVKWTLIETPAIALAAKSGNEKIMRMLLEAGADANAMETSIISKVIGTPAGNTALIYSTLGGHFEIVKMLVEFGADPNLRGEDGKTALELALRKKKLKPIADWLSRVGKKKAKPVFAGKKPNLVEIAAPTTLESAKRILANLCGTEPEPHPAVGGFFVCRLSAKKAGEENSARKQGNNVVKAYEKILDDEFNNFIAHGFFLFRTYEPGLGMRLCLVQAKDKYEVIKKLKTGSANYGVSNKALILILQGLEKEQPFQLVEASSGSMGGRFTTPIKNAKNLTRKLADFCPFVLEEASNKLVVLEKKIRSKKSFRLWWD